LNPSSVNEEAQTHAPFYTDISAIITILSCLVFVVLVSGSICLCIKKRSTFYFLQKYLVTKKCIFKIRVSRFTRRRSSATGGRVKTLMTHTLWWRSTTSRTWLSASNTTPPYKRAHKHRSERPTIWSEFQVTTRALSIEIGCADEQCIKASSAHAH